jgi:DNA-binding MarR family transcriptional regulator
MKPGDWDEAPEFARGPRPPEDRPPISAEEDSPEFAAIRQIELLARLHHMAFRSLFQEGGLPPAQAGAMKIIIRTPGMSQRELADKLHIQRATATVMLQKMEKAGYIDRRPDQDDQRISRIYPTSTALTEDAENLKNVSAYFSRCFRNIPQQDFDTMVSTLAQVGKNLREILDENPEPIGKE